MVVIPSASVRENFLLLVFKFSVSNASQRLCSSLKVILTFRLSHSQEGASHHLSISELPWASFSSGEKKISANFVTVCTKGKHMYERNLWKPNKRNSWWTEDSLKSRQARSLRKQQGEALLDRGQGWLSFSKGHIQVYSSGLAECICFYSSLLWAHLLNSRNSFTGSHSISRTT